MSKGKGFTPTFSSKAAKKRGFTLIELLVSVTIFVTVMVISMGSLLSISAAERKAESLKTVMNNLHFGLESMSRSIRTGITYHCGNTGALDTPRDCDTGGTFFAFEAVGGNTSDSGDQVVYYHEADAGDCGPSSVGGCIMRSINGGSNFSPITAPEVNVTSLTFYVIGSPAEFESDPLSAQPKVVITLTGQVLLGVSQSTDFSLQTSVTQRLYDQ